MYLHERSIRLSFGRGGGGGGVVSEPDPRKNWKEGLGDRLGWKCTVRPECRHTSDWFMIACLHAFIGNTNHNPVVQLKEIGK